MTTEVISEPAAFDVLNPPSDVTATLPGKFLWYSRLAQAKREQTELLDQITARMNELEPHLLEEMAANGIERQTVDGMTLFPRTEFYVSKKAEKDGVTTELVIKALRKCGCDYMVSEGYSASSLKAKVKEWRENGVDVPSVLAELLNIGETLKLAARKA